MDTNAYEIILTDMAKEELEYIYEYISEKLYANQAANNLMNKIERNILMLDYKQVVIYRVIYGKRDYINIEE